MTSRDFLKAWKTLKKQLKNYRSPWVDYDSKKQKDPLRVLISCIISLRTKDNVTEMVSKKLFDKAQNIDNLAKLPLSVIETLLYPAGFYKTKAKTIKELCNYIILNHKGIVPDTLDELIKIKGVGRKTANLVLTLGYGQDAICVDTHVHRIPNRWGLIKTKKPDETELALSKLIPQAYWKEINKYLVSFGINICKPISPICSICSIYKYCKKINVNKSR